AYYYHNSISLDNTASTGGTTRGFYQTITASNVKFQNNIISITRGGSGTKYALYFGTTTSTITADNNVLYVNAAAGTNGIGYYSTGYGSLAEWKMANSKAYDQNSFEGNPRFVNASTGDLTPTTGFANNRGSDLSVSTDISGTSRSTTPDPGAYEFSATCTSLGEWTGAESNKWGNANNWSCYMVPDITTDVIIPSGLATYPQVTTGIIQANNMTVATGATVTVSGGIMHLYGNFNNSGTLTHTSGTVEMIGDASQQLSGTTLSNLKVVGSGTKVLATNVTVTGSVVMEAGLLNTSGNTLILGPTATLTESSTSYITGNVETTRSVSTATTVNFGCIGLELTPASGSNMPGATTVVRVTGSPVNTGTSSSIPRYFDIVSVVDNNLDVTMAFKYLDNEVSTFNEDNFVLYKSTDGGTSWVKQAGSAVDKTTNTVTLANVTGFSSWTVGENNAPLPVELVSFDAVRRGNDVLTTWTTASEINSKGFEIQVSDNSTDFRTIGFMASNNGNTLQHYSFTDSEEGKTGIRYYRLKQSDFDGTVSYSIVRAVHFDGQELVVGTYPNPFAEVLNLYINASENEMANVRIVDVAGKTVLEKEVKLERGSNTIALDFDNANPGGIYLLTTQIGAKIFTTKLIRQ
ncbi:MAG: T9SS type A sorting domain-containing protein, partial [Hymenobacteraceae bacterium]|nr:T9SS type A sorting domain-containing protein [Hymenobacteraceae bacterium]MDX5396629.1 T9SS type A sorting domain-containing protein [Hymenobacteraceae bacterium]MDX5512691.1 T9SS type A sorting domain-containing protein [Hymenobacteraceae bacterium]